MASLLDLADIRQRFVVLDAARRVQYNPLLPDGTTTDRMWATYTHAVMERMLTCFGIVYPARIVLDELAHLKATYKLALSTTNEHDESWALEGWS